MIMRMTLVAFAAFGVVLARVVLAELPQVAEGICPKADGPLQMDGRLNAAAWKKAATVGSFVTLGSRMAPDKDVTSAMVLHDDSALYVGVTCRAGEAKSLRKSPRDPGAAWRDDHLEIFLNPFPDSEDYYHLVVDRAGNTFGKRHVHGEEGGKAPPWDGEWQAETAQTESGWTAEVRLPFASFGVKGVKRGDLWRFKIGRDGGRDGPLMWPPNPTSSFHSRVADGALYFDDPNLLVNGDFETGKVVNGAPEPWQAHLTSAEVKNAPQGSVETIPGGLPPGKRALLIKKLPTALYWPQVWSGEYTLEPGGVYEFSVMAKGNMSQLTLRANGIVKNERAKMGKAVEPTKEFSRLSFRFIVPEKTEKVAVGVAARAGVSGEVTLDNAILRRVLHADDAASALAAAYAPPDWSPDPDPVHGLESFTERAGHKPWDLLWRDGQLLTWRVMFKDRKYGTDLWLLDNSPTREYVVTASIWPGWNADGSVMLLPADRCAPKEPKRPWIVNADFSRMAPAPTGGMPLWDLEDPDVYYYHTPGKVEKVSLRTGERRVLVTWPPRPRERSYGLTKDNRSVFVVDHDGGEWVSYAPGDKPVPYIRALDCYGQAPDGKSVLASDMAATDSEWGPIFRIIVGQRVYTDDGRIERVIVPISGHTEYLKTFVSGRVKFPTDAKLPETKDLNELFNIYHLYPSCSHGHLSFSPDGEYICWDGSPSFYRTRDNGDSHNVQVSPNGFCYHTCWFRDPRFFVTCVRGYRALYDRPVNASLLSQVFTDGTWQAVCDIKMRPNAYYYGGNFATFSRDATKIHYESSMLGVPKNYVAVMARPQPPRGVAWKAEGNAVVLSWTPPPHHREIRGYLVYRSERSGDGYGRIMPAPVNGTSYRDSTTKRGRAYYYVVTALEHSGLESGYSSEAARAGIGLAADLRDPLVVYAEAEEALAGLKSADKPGISMGRDRLGASNWYYIYRTPTAKEGAVSLRVEAPATGEYFVWLRVRKGGEAAGRWSVSVDGVAVGEAECARREWTWVKAGEEPRRLTTGAHSLSLCTTDATAQADIACLATDPAFVPSRARPEDREPPAAVAGLKAAEVRDRAVRLAWQANFEPDFSHYNVYGAREPVTEARQAWLLGSPTYPEFIDWGLRAGQRYTYAVTAVDRHGNESALSPVVDATTPARAYAPQEMALCFDQADLRGAFQRGIAAGTHAKEYVILPEKTAPADVAAAKASWEVNVAQGGKYYFWLRYLPRGEASSRAAAVTQEIRALLDGKRVAVLGGGETDLSLPENAIRPEFWTWARPVTWDLTAVELPSGKHALTLENLTPGVRYDVLFITDEPSFLPQDGRLRQR